jgi:hypothetical protein
VRKICILGFAEATRLEAPFSDPSVEFWGMNRLYREKLPKVEWARWFEMHEAWHLDKYLKGTPGFDEFLTNFKAPIYMHQRLERYSTSVTYPIEEVCDHIEGLSKTNRYLVSTPAYALALALYEGIEEIHIYGIDMIADREWQYQRPNMEYLIGFARGLGVNIILPENTALCKGPGQYGVDPIGTGPHKRLYEVMEEELESLSKLSNQLFNQEKTVVARQHFNEGAQIATKHWMQSLREIERGYYVKPRKDLQKMLEAITETG